VSIDLCFLQILYGQSIGGHPAGASLIDCEQRQVMSAFASVLLLDRVGTEALLSSAAAVFVGIFR
jgi:hypothetical protein